MILHSLQCDLSGPVPSDYSATFECVELRERARVAELVQLPLLPTTRVYIILTESGLDIPPQSEQNPQQEEGDRCQLELQGVQHPAA